MSQVPSSPAPTKGRKRKRVTLAALMARHRSTPAKEYLSIVEAASFLAFGAYLGSNDLATVFQSATEDEKVVERVQKATEKAIEEGRAVEHGEVVRQWLRASEEIRKKAHDGKLTFRGLLALSLCELPTGEEDDIPAGFFAGKDTLMVGLSEHDTLYRNDPSRDKHYEGVRVRTDQFISIFPPAKLSRSAFDKKAILAYAELIYSKTGQAPSEGQLRAKFQVSRAPLRKIIKEFPEHLRRQPYQKSVLADN